MARLIVSPPDIEQTELPATSGAVYPLEIRRSEQAARPGKPLSYQRPPCLDGVLTVSRLRPFLRRRDSTSRPHRSSIRARNPCLLSRFRLRGR